MTPLFAPLPTTLPASSRIEDLTRREFISSAFGAALLIACGDDDEPEADPTAMPTQGPTTRRVNHAYGSIDVPVEPQRVLVIDNNALPYVLELGVTPIAAGTLPGTYYEGKDFHPALYTLGVEKTTPFSRDEPDYEMIAGLNPDLIIGSTFAIENRVKDGGETYQRMAPMAAIDSDLPVFEQIRGYARILGREAQAEALIADFQKSISDSAADVTVKEVSIVRAFGDAEIFIYTEKEPFTSLWIDLLGVTVVPGPEEASPAGTIITSSERMGDLKGEALVVIFGLERLETNPLWPLIPAVQAGNVHHAGDYLVYSGNGGLNALRDQIVAIAQFLASIK